jgi:hypothetical protein
VGCRGGGCGVCRVRVLDGAYTTLRMSRQAHVEADEAAGVVLACRIVPVGRPRRRAGAPAEPDRRPTTRLHHHRPPVPTTRQRPIRYRYKEQATMAITGVLRPGIHPDPRPRHGRGDRALPRPTRPHRGQHRADGRVYLKGWDEFDHHSVILREADEAGMDFMGFKVLDDATLTELTRQARGVGRGGRPHRGRRAARGGTARRLHIPSGHRIELFAQMDRSPTTAAGRQPRTSGRAEPRGMARHPLRPRPAVRTRDRQGP